MARNALASVLVATDFSETASWAISRACLLPLAPAAKLLLLHVIPNTLPAEVRRQTEVKAHDDLQKAAASAVQATSVARAADLVIETAVSVGKPFAEIVRRARQMDAEMAVVGRHGHRPARDLFIGSTAKQLIRDGDVPVLAVSTKPMRPYRHPLVAVDPEHPSLRMMELVAQILGTGVKVVPVVHACRVPFEGWMRRSITQTGLNSWRQEFREQASAQLAKLSRSFGDRRFRFKPIVREGRAAPVILREAARRRSDLVALGKHGRFGVWRALPSGISERVVAAALCDVLVDPFAPRSSIPDRFAATNIQSRSSAEF